MLPWKVLSCYCSLQASRKTDPHKRIQFMLNCSNMIIYVQEHTAQIVMSLFVDIYSTVLLLFYLSFPSVMVLGGLGRIF